MTKTGQTKDEIQTRMGSVKSKRAIFKTRNGELRNGTEREKPESLKPGMRKAGIFKTRNEKSRNL
jgi:hypothetical protein